MLSARKQLCARLQFHTTIALRPTVAVLVSRVAQSKHNSRSYLNVAVARSTEPATAGSKSQLCYGIFMMHARLCTSSSVNKNESFSTGTCTTIRLHTDPIVHLDPSALTRSICADGRPGPQLLLDESFVDVFPLSQ